MRIPIISFLMLVLSLCVGLAAPGSSLSCSRSPPVLSSLTSLKHIEVLEFWKEEFSCCYLMVTLLTGGAVTGATSVSSAEGRSKATLLCS